MNVAELKEKREDLDEDVTVLHCVVETLGGERVLAGPGQSLFDDETDYEE